MARSIGDFQSQSNSQTRRIVRHFLSRIKASICHSSLASVRSIQTPPRFLHSKKGPHKETLRVPTGRGITRPAVPFERTILGKASSVRPVIAPSPLSTVNEVADKKPPINGAFSPAHESINADVTPIVVQIV